MQVRAPPPISGSGRPVAVKTLPQGPPVGPPKETNPGARSVPIQGGLPAPASPKGSSQSHLIGKIVSPRGNPPPKVLRRPSGPSSVADGQTPRSVASEATAVLEEKLRKKKGKPNAPGRMNRLRCIEMIENGMSNKGLIITNKSIDIREILDEEIGHQVNDHHPLILRMTITDHPHQGAPDLEDVSKPDIIGQGLAETRGLNVEGEAPLMKREGHDPNEDRVNIGSSKDKKRRDSSSSSRQQEAERHEEDRNKSKSSQPVQAKAVESQNPPPLPPPDTAPMTASSASTQQSQAAQASQAVAQPVQRQVAQAVPAIIQTAPASGTAVAQLPIAKAVPLRQSQGHVQAVLHNLIPRQCQQDTYRDNFRWLNHCHNHCIHHSNNYLLFNKGHSWQQMAAPPGLGTTQQLTQAAHIQHLEQQLAALRSQLRATQPQAQSRHSSHSPEGWNWDDQSQGSQWHGHGWYNWGNGRGYQ